MSFKSKVSADKLLQESDALEKAMKLEGYDRMIENPLADAEEVSRDFLFEVFAEGDSDKYMKKASRDLDGNGGGHKIAAGATIQSDKEKDFLKKTDLIISKQVKEKL